VFYKANWNKELQDQLQYLTIALGMQGLGNFGVKSKDTTKSSIMLPQ
jgi:hypothetical protein